MNSLKKEKEKDFHTVEFHAIANIGECLKDEEIEGKERMSVLKTYPIALYSFLCFIFDGLCHYQSVG